MVISLVVIESMGTGWLAHSEIFSLPLRMFDLLFIDFAEATFNELYFMVIILANLLTTSIYIYQAEYQQMLVNVEENQRTFIKLGAI